MNFKKRILLYLLIFFVGSVVGQGTQKTFKVVLDAGHGAHDPGCLGTKVNEKTVNLSMALKVGKLIEEHCPDVKVIYTRKTDVFVELYRRAEIANKEHADLFISFHCNSSENPNGNGVETYLMGLSKSEANQAVARRENSAILKEKNYQENYGGFDPNAPESNIIFSLYSSAYMNKSIILADMVQKNLVSISHLTDRGVKQANYWVLYRVAMPSILIEMGFLSNPGDQAFLNNQENQNKIAAGIYNAFVDYIDKINNTKHVHLPVSGAVAPKGETPPAIQGAEPDTAAAAAAAEPTPNVNPAENSKEVRFKVQILASPEKLDVTDSRIWNIPQLGCYQENGLGKYTAGDETTYEAANKLLSDMKRTHKDAFMIAFQGDKKISVSEARKLTKK